MMETAQKISSAKGFRPPESGYILVVGLGRSGCAMARFLINRGMIVVATDIDSNRADVGKDLEAMGIRCEIGFHRTETFEQAKIIVTSPGIPLNMDYFNRARRKQVPIIGELDLVARYLKEPIVAVTGTNGKTTVTTLISEMLTASGLDVFTGGNIGTPIVEYLDRGSRVDVIVAELSSFQLDTATAFIPDVAVLLNIAQDHQDRYLDYAAYEDSKWSLFKNQSSTKTAIVNADIDNCKHRTGALKSRLFVFGDKGLHGFYQGAATGGDGIDIKDRDGSLAGLKKNKAFIDISGSSLKGEHNRQNIAAAALAALAAGGSIEGIEKTITGFTGLAHRIQYVETVNGVDYYNDSKATNSDAVLKALAAVEAPVILILGGRSKQDDFSSLIPGIKGKVKEIIAMGESQNKISAALSDCCRISKTESMEETVVLAHGMAIPGDTVLLSPACASFDLYGSYKERGLDFIHHVNSLTGEL